MARFLANTGGLPFPSTRAEVPGCIFVRRPMGGPVLFHGPHPRGLDRGGSRVAGLGPHLAQVDEDGILGETCLCTTITVDGYDEIDACEQANDSERLSFCDGLP